VVDLGGAERVLLLLGLANGWLGHLYASSCLERRFVGVAAGGGRGRAPGVVVRRAAVGAGAAEAAAGRPPGRAVDLGGRVLQGRTDLLDVHLDDCALLALAGLVRALLQPTLRDHAHAPLERLGHVLGRLPPNGAAQEQRLAVLPLVRVAVERAG